MLATLPKDILHQFSEGRIGWREACRRLDLDSYNELDTMMRQHHMPLFQPDAAQAAARTSALDALLYGEE